MKVSFDTPEYTGEVTGLGATRLLEAIRELQIRPRIYQASSSEMFGKVDEDAAARDDAVLSAQPVRRRQGVRLSG